MAYPAGQQNHSILAKLQQQTPLRHVVRYGLATMAVTVAMGLKIGLETWVGPGLPTFVTFYPAVMGTALLAGFGPGLAATACAGLMAAYWILPASGPDISSPVDRLGMMIFISMCVFMTMVAEMYRRKRDEIIAHACESILNETRARLAAFAAATFEGIVESNAGRIVDCNDQLARMLGYSVAELQGMEIAALIAPEDLDRVMSNMRLLQPVMIEHAMLRKDGTRLIVETHGRPAAQDSAVRHTVIRDITARKETEQSIQRAKKEWERTFDSVPDLIAIMDDQHRITRVNRAMAKRLGTTPEQCIGQSCHFHVHGTNHPPEFCPHSLTLLDAQTHEAEVRECRLDGTFLVTTTPLLDEQGQMTGSIHIARNITERKQTEDVLRFLAECGENASGEGFFQKLARFLSQTLAMEFVCVDQLDEDNLSAQTLTVFHNGQFEDNIAYALQDTPCAEAVGKRICSFPQKLRELFPKDTLLQDLQAESYLGTTLWNTQGKPIGLIAVIGRQPLANTRQAEAILQLVSSRAAGELESQVAREALKKSELFRKLILDSLKAHIAVIDDQGTIVTVNQSWLQFAEENDATDSCCIYPGANYLEACRNATATGSPLAREALVGIESILSGHWTEFTLEYPCHSPTQKRWFMMNVVQPYNNMPGAIISHIDISDRKLVESALQESEKRFRDIASASADWIWEIDSNGRYIFASTNIEEVLGYAPEEILGRTPFDLMPDDEAQRVRNEFKAITDRMAPFRDLVNLNRHKNGETRYILTSGVPILDAAGNLCGYRGVDRDITTRKLAEELVRESEERLRFHMDNSPMAVIECDDKFVVTRWSGASERIFGWSAADTVGRPIMDLNILFEDDIPINEKIVAQLVDGATRQVVATNHIYTKNREIRYCTWYNSVLTDRQGKIRSVLSNVIDVTALKQAEQERQKFVSLVDHSDEFIGMCDLKLVPFYVNQAALRLVGLDSMEEASQLSVLDFFYPEDLAFIEKEFFPQVLRAGHAEAEVRFRHVKSGQPIWMIFSVFYIRDLEGLPVALATVSRDISSRKRAQEELQKAHDELEQRVNERTEDLRAAVNVLRAEIAERVKAEEELSNSAREIEDLYEFAPCGYHSLDKDGVFIRINATELSWLGYERNEILGKLKAPDIMTDDSLVIFEHYFPPFKQGVAISEMRLNFIRKDGSILPVLLNATPIIDYEGNYLMCRSTIYDITDLVKAEESIHRLNLLYLTLSETGKAIAHVPDRDRLFQEICRIAVEQGGFLLSWVGVIDEDSNDIRIVTACGATDYLDDIRITSEHEEPHGTGPTGISIREGTYHICNDFQNDPCTRPWHERGKQHGIQASASIALRCGNKVIGALTLYAGEINFFDQQHVELLVQIGADVSFALNNLVQEAKRQQTEQALQKETIQRLEAVEALRQQELILIQQNRHAAMGEMIGNIAHQWRQPLNTLGLLTQRIEFFYGSPNFNKEFLSTSVTKSLEIIQYMSRTIDDFRNFFSTEREKSEFSVNGAVSKALSLVEASFKDRNIHIEWNKTTEHVIYGYPNEFAQVMLNILINAKDVIIERNVPSPRVSIFTGSDNGAALVTVADNAGGIPAEILTKIFDPYFTTKGPQQGTGIGLFMSKTIIENNMGGRLTVRNTDEGAEFRIEVQHGPPCSPVPSENVITD